ncbi:MAG: hypothetical protein KQH79_13810 [Bacteroidetes bacterium]|nr:hypothetical protein [Bacteroidota bacterium]
MKKLLLILFIQFFGTALMAADTTQVENNLISNTNRRFYLDEQLEVYKYLPSNLWLWDNGDFSSISFKGLLDEGNFKTVDDFDKNEQFSFKSESVQSFNKTGWRFYGNFTLNLSNHDNADWNLGYEKSEIGNPYRLITQRNGDFNVKHYGLQGIMNKNLGDKFSVGFGIKYHGDLYFRLSDTRNEFYNLTMEVTGAVNYLMKENKYISLGVSYYYRKASPQYINQYKTNGPEYYLYINEGLGDFNQVEMSENMYKKNQNPKYYLSYFSGEKNKFSIAYSAYIGNEHWDYKITSTLTETDQELYKYEYFSNELITSYLVNKENYKNFNLIEAKYIDGTGFKNRGIFQKTFTYSGLNLKGTSKLIQPKSNLFYLSVISVDFENISKKDMVYAQQIAYTNVNTNIKTGYLLQVNTKNRIAFDIEGSYKYNLSYTHDVVSAGSKMYTLNLAYNEIAYHSANYYTIGGQVKWFKQMPKLGTEFLVKYYYLTPTDVKFSNEYSLITDKKYRYFWEASLNFYF